jgi:hypothetical protein
MLILPLLSSCIALPYQQPTTSLEKRAIPLPRFIENMPTKTKVKVLAGLTLTKWAVTGVVIGAIAGGLNEDSS